MKGREGLSPAVGETAAMAENDRTNVYEDVADSIIAACKAQQATDWIHAQKPPDSGGVTKAVRSKGANATSSYRDSSPRKSTATPFPSAHGQSPSASVTGGAPTHPSGPS